MLIYAFGASVTAQGIHHKTGEITGYVSHLEKILKERDKDIVIGRKAAGSSHFNEAGYVLLDEVLSFSPDILLLDWHSTGMLEFDSLLWASAIKKIRDSKVKHTLILIFPRESSGEWCETRKNILQARACIGSNIHILNLYKHLGERVRPELHLRDYVHTNAAGGARYAEIISEAIFAILDDPSTCLIDDGESIPLVEVSEPPIVTSLLLDEDYAEKQYVQFCTHILKPGRMRFVVDQIVGPHSPIGILESECGIATKISFWDPSCYYSRKSFGAIGGYIYAENSKKFSFSLRILDELPAYINCKDNQFNFSTIQERFFKFHKIYAIGAEIYAAD